MSAASACPRGRGQNCGRCRRGCRARGQHEHPAPRGLTRGAAPGVRCRYDSEAGLGDEFLNWMGALMGCVLSPDKAKILLNTIVAAISLVARGVKLFGYEPEDREAAWRAVAQAAYADDWAGVFGSEDDLLAVWALWRVWEAASGTKLGVKLTLKTVVTGAAWDAEGKPRDVLATRRAL